jgi:hypothetical protein
LTGSAERFFTSSFEVTLPEAETKQRISIEAHKRSEEKKMDHETNLLG